MAPQAKRYLSAAPLIQVAGIDMMPATCDLSRFADFNRFRYTASAYPTGMTTIRGLFASPTLSRSPPERSDAPPPNRGGGWRRWAACAGDRPGLLVPACTATKAIDLAARAR